MKQAFGLSRLGPLGVALALLILCGAANSARAQTPSATPDSVVVQIANTAATPAVSPTPVASPSPTPTPAPSTIRDTFAQDVSGDGRFVVMESTGDIATNRSATRNNLDGNIEIFLFDYAQRRIFQITNTKNAVKDIGQSPQLATNIEVSILNLRPMISRDGKWIVFASNAYSDAAPTLTPKNFDGEANEAALKLDGNMEIFIYRIPDVAATDLSSGAEVPEVDLAAGTMTRVTNTAASRTPTAGGTSGNQTVAPYVADDNRAATLNDDGSYVAFISTRNISNVSSTTNTDANPEVFIWHRTSASFVQVTVTSGAFSFNDNPSLSGSGTVLAFYSTADINTTEAAADRGNGEVYLADFNGTVVSNVRAVTRTPRDAEGDPVNIVSPGRRLSRDGNLLLFESTAAFNANGTLNGGLTDALGTYLYRSSDNTFTQVANRAPSGQLSDVLRFPVFTGDNANIVFASTLNLRATNGEALAADSTDGLNPGTATNRPTQIFSVGVPAAGQSPTNYRRLTRLTAGFAGIQPLMSDTLRRSTFSASGVELGGGNPDLGSEAFYMIVPPVTSEVPSPPAGAVTFFTGASDRPVLGATPTPTPPAVSGLAPGMLGIVRSTIALAPAPLQVDPNNAEEATRRPPLPVELNGVTVSIGGIASGLYFVSPGQINFVVAPGAVGARFPTTVVINNNGAAIRTTLDLVPSLPDIFTTTNGAGGRAAVLNVTNPCIAPTAEPFKVKTTRPTGGNCAASTTEEVATELLITLTGVRNATIAQLNVKIGNIEITGAGIVSVGPSRTSGFDQIIVRLPDTLANAGDVPIIITVTNNAGAFTSRPADTAPRITITQ